MKAVSSAEHRSSKYRFVPPWCSSLLAFVEWKLRFTRHFHSPTVSHAQSAAAARQWGHLTRRHFKSNMSQMTNKPPPSPPCHPGIQRWKWLRITADTFIIAASITSKPRWQSHRASLMHALRSRIRMHVLKIYTRQEFSSSLYSIESWMV